MYNMNHVDQIAERFGDVSSLYLGNQPYVILSAIQDFQRGICGTGGHLHRPALTSSVNGKVLMDKVILHLTQILAKY